MRLCTITVILFCLLAPLTGAAITVATVGDSFADRIYLGLHLRPDLLKQQDIKVVRWSRPIIGLARDDYFDYPGWLHNNATLGMADFCVVQVGSNDMQAIPDGHKHWITYRSNRWQSMYKDRVRNMLGILKSEHCKEVIWVLQPGFESYPYMSRERTLINEMQSQALNGTGTRVLDLETTAEAYSPDKTHFNGPFTLKLGAAVLQAVASTKQAIDGGCSSCHRPGFAEKIYAGEGILPLHPHVAPSN